MVNVNFLNSVRAGLSMVTTLFVAGERVAKSLDNVAQLGENWTGAQVEEQKLLQTQRMADLEAKVNKRYADEKKQWTV